MSTSREKGIKAEEIAVNYLQNQGFEILETNWFNHHHELDIIARKDDMLVVVEVKSLASNFIKEPYEAINRNKQRMIISATNAYIRSHNINDEVRFDVISILVKNDEPQIDYIENAFYPRVR